jgi:hypothetical protein
VRSVQARAAKTCGFASEILSIGEPKVEDGMVTYKLKDSESTLVSGSLGEVAGPARQVQYLVLRAQRYSAYDLVDLRLSALNLYAGHETEVESFESGDGTGSGALPSEGDGLDPDVQQSARDALTCQWLAWWWPTLQIALNAGYGACSVSVLLTVDILGCVSVSDADFSITGIDFDDEENADHIASEAMPVLQDTGDTGFALSFATALVTVSSWLVINWALYGCFLIAIALWNICMALHLWAVWCNLANGYTTVGDALQILAGVVLTWVVKLANIWIRESVLTERVMSALESIFGKMNPLAMAATKWTLIICGLLWIAILARMISDILYIHILSDIFPHPSVIYSFWGG